MILGCLLLVLILNEYGFSTKVSALIPAPDGSAPALAATTDIFPDHFSTVHL
jgi:hypothetical protein